MQWGPGKRSLAWWWRALEVILKCCTFEPRVPGMLLWSNAGCEGHLDGEFPAAIVRHNGLCCERPVVFNGNPIALVLSTVELDCVSFFLACTCQKAPIHDGMDRLTVPVPSLLNVTEHVAALPPQVHGYGSAQNKARTCSSDLLAIFLVMALA